MRSFFFVLFVYAQVSGIRRIVIRMLYKYESELRILVAAARKCLCSENPLHMLLLSGNWTVWLTVSKEFRR
jgi:hypothetical protein